MLAVGKRKAVGLDDQQGGREDVDDVARFAPVTATRQLAQYLLIRAARIRFFALCRQTRHR